MRVFDANGNLKTSVSAWDWSTFVAVSNINVAEFNLLNVSKIGIGTNTPATDIDIVSNDATYSPNINLTYALGGVGNFSCGLQFFNENGLNGSFTATANGYVGGTNISANQCVFLARQAGGLLLSAYGGGPLILATGGASEAARIEETLAAFLVGLVTLDGTANTLIQCATGISAGGDYWSAGQQGFTGTLAAAAGKNVVGGIIVN